MKPHRTIPVSARDKIYREYANGRMEYWTYSDGQKISVSRAWAENEVCRGNAVYVEVK